MKLRLGTRGSQLAVTQSTTVADALRAHGHDVELVVITTRGDTERRSLMDLAGLGVFAAELRTALLRGECDLAVHSYKDLPVAEVPGLVVAAVPEREDTRDALCSDGRTLAELPEGARIGTGSPRRVAQLRARRPDCTFVDIRGNVGTRLARVAPGDLDAVVLAAAGLARLGLSEHVTELLDILPAPAQGALAVECRADDHDVLMALAELDDLASRAAAEAERAVLAGLGGGCAAPIAARAEVSDGVLRLTAGVFAPDGGSSLEAVVESSPREAARAGARAAGQLLADGAAAITELDASRQSRLAEFHDDARLWSPDSGPLAGLTVLVARQGGALVEGLQEAGARVWGEQLLRRVDLDVDLEALPAVDWYAITSAATVDSLAQRGWRIPEGSRIAAVGSTTAEALRSAGYAVDIVPGPRSSAEALLESFPDGPGTVCIPGSVRARPVLAEGLAARGWDVTRIPLYTVEDIEPTGSLRVAWERGQVNAALVTSGSVAESIDAHLGWPEGMHVVAFGRPTAALLERLGVPCAVADTQDAAGVIAAFTTLLGAES